MGRQQDVTGQSVQHGKTVLEAPHKRGMIQKAITVSRYRGQAIDIDNTKAAFFFASLPGPAGSSRRVTGSEMRRDREIADMECPSVLNCFDPGNRSDGDGVEIML